jgi:hypothetical protein
VSLDPVRAPATRPACWIVDRARRPPPILSGRQTAWRRLSLRSATLAPTAALGGSPIRTDGFRAVCLEPFAE